MIKPWSWSEALTMGTTMSSWPVLRKKVKDNTPILWVALYSNASGETYFNFQYNRQYTWHLYQLREIFEFESVWKNHFFLNLVRIILLSVVIEGSNQTHSCEVINQDHSCNRSKVDKGWCTMPSSNISRGTWENNHISPQPLSACLESISIWKRSHTDRDRH